MPLQGDFIFICGVPVKKIQQKLPPTLLQPPPYTQVCEVDKLAVGVSGCAEFALQRPFHTSSIMAAEAEDSYLASDVSDYDLGSDDDCSVVRAGIRPAWKAPRVTNACAAQVASPVKKAPAKKAGKGPLKESKKAGNKASGGSKRTKTVEETYVKMTQLQHILKRPDTYGVCQRLYPLQAPSTRV